MHDMTAEMAAQSGVTVRHSRMDNGELRFRIVANDGSGYARTVAVCGGRMAEQPLP